MNTNGLYSGGIALVTIVLVIAVSFNITSTVQAEKTQGTADNIIDAKWEIQNAGHLLEAAAIDAIVDEIFVACKYNENSIKTRVESYITINSLETRRCTVSNIVVDGSSSSTSISFDLECSNSTSPGLTTNYKKEISFQKSMVITPNGNECSVAIDDYYITGEITG